MNYGIKSAAEANKLEIFFDKNTNKLSYKNKNGIVTSINTNNNESGGSEVTSFIALSSEDGAFTIPKFESDINGRQAWKIQVNEEWVQLSWNDVDERWEYSTNNEGVLYYTTQSYTPGLISYPPLFDSWVIVLGGTIDLSTVVVSSPTQQAVEDVAQSTAHALVRAFRAYQKASEYTETIVNITPTETTYSDGRPLVASGILAMGTTPIGLLPAAGVGKYYDIDKIILEYTHVSTGYEFINNGISHINIAGFALLDTQFMELTDNAVKIVKSGGYIDGLSGQVESSFGAVIDDAVLLITNNFMDPTLGDGTLRVKIYHKTITFGA